MGYLLSRQYVVTGISLMGEGLLIDRDLRWVCRFHQDEKAWMLHPPVFVDYGSEMTNGYPALLKCRDYLHRVEAVKRSQEFQLIG